MKLTHINEKGEARMVDVSDKQITQRLATATGFIGMKKETLALVKSGGHSKGDVLSTARLAGIMAAKKTADMIPMCHPLALTSVSVDFQIDADKSGIDITATCKLAGRTGVEMEALSAVSVAALTIYDMCKAVDKEMIIGEIKLIEKTGGKSGTWQRQT